MNLTPHFTLHEFTRSQTASRLGEKLSGALGGRRPAVVKASDSLYRIRVTGLSKESANAMCGKVKAAGGACFVAR